MNIITKKALYSSVILCALNQNVNANTNDMLQKLMHTSQQESPAIILAGPLRRVERRDDRRDHASDRVDDKQEFREERRDCTGEGPDCRSDNRQDKRQDTIDRGQDRRGDRGVLR